MMYFLKKNFIVSLLLFAVHLFLEGQESCKLSTVRISRSMSTVSLASGTYAQPPLNIIHQSRAQEILHPSSESCCCKHCIKPCFFACSQLCACIALLWCA